jgi:hypothetical protein
VSRTTGVDFSLDAFFSDPTISGMAARLRPAQEC